MTSPLFTFVPPVALAVLVALLAAGLGRRCLGREPADLQALALAVPLGLTLLGLASFTLLALGLLRPWPLATAAGLAALAARPGLASLRREIPAACAGIPPRRRRLGAAAGATAAGVLGLLALYPPTAWDSTIYHLPLARAFVEAGGFVFVAPLRFPVFPLLGESLFAVVALPGGDLAAQQLQVLATLATALLLAVWAEARLTGGGRAGQWLAPAIWLGTPIVVLYAGSAFVDPLLTLFATASLVALDRYRQGGEWRWALVAGALAGSAAAVKYLGLFFVAVVPLLVALSPPASEDPGHRRRLSLGAAVALLAVLVLAPWYARIVVLTGNPVFPFGARLFGESPWHSVPMAPLAAVVPGAQLPDGPGVLPRRLTALPRLPLDLLFARQRYNQQPPFSPAFLFWWPALALAAWRRPWTRPWALVWLGYAACLLPLPADSRYLLPVYPLAALLLAAGAEAATELVRLPLRVARRSLAAGAAVLALGLPLYAAFHVVRQGPIPATPAAREAYVARWVPGYRGLAVALSRRPGEPVYLLHLERLHYHAAGRGRGDHSGPARFAAVVPLLDDPAALRDRLAALGTRLLLAPLAEASRIPRHEAFVHAFRTVYRDDEVELLEALPRDEKR